jgi:hypothetical protein
MGFFDRWKPNPDGSYTDTKDDSGSSGGGSSDDGSDDSGSDSTAGGGTSSNPAPGLGGGGGVSDTSPDDDDDSGSSDGSSSDSDNPFGGSDPTPDIMPDNDNPFDDGGSSGGGGSSGSSSSGGGSDDSGSPPVGNTPSSGNLPSQGGDSDGDGFSDSGGGSPDSSGSDSDNPFGGSDPTPDIMPDNDNPFDDSGGSGGGGSSGSSGGDSGSDDSPPVGNTPSSGNLPGGQPDNDTGRDPEDIAQGPASQEQTPEQGIEEDGSPAEQQTAQQAEQQFQAEFESQTGRELDDEDVRVTREQRNGQTVAVPELTDSGQEQLQFERNQRQLDARRDAIAQVDDQTEANLTAGDDLVVDDGRVELTEQGRIKEAAAQADDISEDDLDVVGGEVVLDTGDTDVSPDTPGTGEDTARSQVVKQLEEQTGVDLSEDDVEFSETDDGEIQGQLSDQGERTVAAANAPFSDVPVVGAVTSGGAVANEQIKDATDPAAEAFDAVTPDQQDAFDAAGSAVDTAADVDIPFTDTDFGDVDDLAPEDQSPEGVNPAIFAAQVEAEQQLNDVSEAEARDRVAADAAAIEQSTVEEFSPAIGRSPASGVNAARGIAGIAGITGGAVAVNEITRPDETDGGELQPGDPTVEQTELEVGGDEVAVESGDVAVPDEVQQASGEISVDVSQDETVDPTQLQLGQQAVIGQQQRQQPEDQREITEEDISNPLGEPEQPAPSNRERQRREDLDPFERTFPTGGSAVVGEDSASSVEDAVERAEQAQEQQVDRGTETDVGQGQTPVTLPGVGTGPFTGTRPGAQSGQATQPATVVDQIAVPDADLAASAVNTSVNDSVTSQNVAQPTIFERLQEPVEITEQTSRNSPNNRRRLRFDDSENDDESPLSPLTFSSTDEIFDTGVIQDIDDALGR